WQGKLFRGARSPATAFPHGAQSGPHTTRSITGNGGSLQSPRGRLAGRIQSMNETLEFLVGHGAAVLFAAVFVEQLGVPLPAAPWLLAAGALAADGKVNWFVALTAATFGSLLADPRRPSHDHGGANAAAARDSPRSRHHSLLFLHKRVDQRANGLVAPSKW